MQAGTLVTTRDVYSRAHGVDFSQLSSAELWFKVDASSGKQLLVKPEEGPLMVLHYRCTSCGYLESYAQGKYP
jgi:hypothetical protein